MKQSILNSISVADAELRAYENKLGQYEAMNEQIGIAITKLEEAITFLDTAYTDLKEHYNNDGNARDENRINNRILEIEDVKKNLEGTVLEASMSDITIINGKISELRSRLAGLNTDLDNLG